MLPDGVARMGNVSRGVMRDPPLRSGLDATGETMPSTEAYLMLSGTLFAIGLVGVIIRRNMITVLMAIELMLNAVNINLVAFSHHLASLEGQIFTIFIITVAAGEAAVGLAIIIQLYRLRSTINIDESRELNG
jgi:NADH-quinone oxidoreductase subunit K